jgi:hypothetical protein
MTSVLNLATDPVDGYEQAVVLLISPEQGDSGEVIDTSGKQRRFEQRTLLDHCNRGETEETDVQD